MGILKKALQAAAEQREITRKANEDYDALRERAKNVRNIQEQQKNGK